MTATLTQPTVPDELTTRQLPPPRREVDAGGPPWRNRGEGLDRPRRALHQPASPVPGPETRNPEPAPRDLLNRLLTLYTTHSNSFNDLRRELDMSMLELLDLLDHPDVTRALERLAQANESRAKILARLNNDSAVSALIDLMDTTDKPETRRKAAGAILRHGKPPAKSVHRATDSDAAAAETSVLPRRNAASGCCQTPTERSSGAGLVSDTPRNPRAGGATGTSPPSLLNHKPSQAA